MHACALTTFSAFGSVPLRKFAATKVTIIHRRCRKNDESWVGRLGQIWLKPDIKYKYLITFLYFWLVFFLFFLLSHLAIKNLQNHFINKISLATF
jgi:hypothetical protein